MRIERAETLQLDLGDHKCRGHDVVYVTVPSQGRHNYRTITVVTAVNDETFEWNGGVLLTKGIGNGLDSKN